MRSHTKILLPKSTQVAVKTTLDHVSAFFFYNWANACFIIWDQKAPPRANYPWNPRSIPMFGAVASPYPYFEPLPPSATPPTALQDRLLLACAQRHSSLAGPKASPVCTAVLPANMTMSSHQLPPKTEVVNCRHVAKTG